MGQEDASNGDGVIHTMKRILQVLTQWWNHLTKQTEEIHMYTCSYMYEYKILDYKCGWFGFKVHKDGSCGTDTRLYYEDLILIWLLWIFVKKKRL